MFSEISASTSYPREGCRRSCFYPPCPPITSCTEASDVAVACRFNGRSVSREENSFLFGGAPITVEYWSITDLQAKAADAFSPNPANAELVAAFRAKNYNTSDGFAANDKHSAKRPGVLFGVDLRSLVGCADFRLSRLSYAPARSV